MEASRLVTAKAMWKRFIAVFPTVRMRCFIVSAAHRRNQLGDHPGIAITGLRCNTIRPGLGLPATQMRSDIDAFPRIRRHYGFQARVRLLWRADGNARTAAQVPR